MPVRLTMVTSPIDKKGDLNSISAISFKNVVCVNKNSTFFLSLYMKILIDPLPIIFIVQKKAYDKLMRDVQW